MKPCLKQLTRCKIIMRDGRVVEATNECDVDGLDVCPRVTAGCETGTGYELCGSTHAEANAAALVTEDMQPIMAFLHGHTWFCKPCQDALTGVGCMAFSIAEEA